MCLMTEASSPVLHVTREHPEDSLDLVFHSIWGALSQAVALLPRSCTASIKCSRCVYVLHVHLVIHRYINTCVTGCISKYTHLRGYLHTHRCARKCTHTCLFYSLHYLRIAGGRMRKYLLHRQMRQSLQSVGYSRLPSSRFRKPHHQA